VVYGGAGRGYGGEGIIRPPTKTCNRHETCAPFPQERGS